MKKLLKLLPKYEDDILRLEFLCAEDKGLTVSVFGKYNHGKSTLLNALTGKDNFKIGPIRTTVENKEIMQDNVVWVDTPGLDADVEQKDDEKSNLARNKSDIVLLVHNVILGEFDKKEFQFLKDQVTLDPSNIEKFIIILTQIDQVEDEDVIKIENKIKSQLEMLGIEIKIIKVSAILHIKGVSEDQKVLINMGNIKKLTSIIDRSKNKIHKQRKKEIKKILTFLKSHICSEKRMLSKKIDNIDYKMTEIKDSYKKDYHNTLRKIKRYEDKIMKGA